MEGRRPFHSVKNPYTLLLVRPPEEVEKKAWMIPPLVTRSQFSPV